MLCQCYKNSFNPEPDCKDVPVFSLQRTRGRSIFLYAVGTYPFSVSGGYLEIFCTGRDFAKTCERRTEDAMKICERWAKDVTESYNFVGRHQQLQQAF